jgi:hypothetical protein
VARRFWASRPNFRKLILSSEKTKKKKVFFLKGKRKKIVDKRNYLK